MTPREIQSYWGETPRRTWGTELVGSLNLDDATKAYLIEVGFPDGLDWGFSFGMKLAALPLSTLSPTLRIFGYDFDAALCFEDKGGGKVVCLEPGGSIRPVNSSLVKFGELLVRYDAYRQNVVSLSEHEALELVAATARALKDIDLPAFATPDGYWPLIVQQMQDGLL